MVILLKWICYFKYRSQNFNWIIGIYFFDKLTLFRLHKKHVKKDRTRQKNQNKIYKCARDKIN